MMQEFNIVKTTYSNEYSSLTPLSSCLKKSEILKWKLKSTYRLKEYTIPVSSALSRFLFLSNVPGEFTYSQLMLQNWYMFLNIAITILRWVKKYCGKNLLRSCLHWIVDTLYIFVYRPAKTRFDLEQVNRTTCAYIDSLRKVTHWQAVK